MTNLKSEIRNLKWRSAFTLMELLIVIAIIAILAGVALSGLASAVNDARVARTRAQINKIDALIMERYESYRTRPLPIRIPAGTPAMPEQFTDNNGNGSWDGGEPFVDANGNGVYDNGAARTRLYVLRELMRLEMPDRISDLCTAAEYADLTAETPNKLDAFASLNNVHRNFLAAVPSVTCSYKRLANRNSIAQGKPWTAAHQSAECLYLILSTMKDGDKSALEYFTPDEIGDVDDDGMKEILDGFGQPIQFLRWAPGFVMENGAVTLQTRNSNEAPDPFDPLRVDPRWGNTDPTMRPYALRPLILSGGLDKSFDISFGVLNMAETTPPNDPYLFSGVLPGTPGDSDGDAVVSSDNITNHFIEPQ